jgi:hypothetical protein
MHSRLPWRRSPPRGFIAFPEGEHLTNRRAEIRYEGTSSTKWHWFTFYDDASSGGQEPDKQLAANRATEQWPITKRNGIAKAAEEAEATVLRTNLQRMMNKGDLPLSLFAIEGSTSDRLISILWLIKDGGGLSGPAQPLVDAISTELYRRRIESSAK